MGLDEALRYIRVAAAAAPFAAQTPKEGEEQQQQKQQQQQQQRVKEKQQQQRQQLRCLQVSRPRRNGLQEIEMQEKPQQQLNSPKAAAAAADSSSSSSSSSNITPSEQWLLQRMQRFPITNKMIEALEAAYDEQRPCKLLIEPGPKGGGVRWRVVPDVPKGQPSVSSVPINIIDNYFSSEDRHSSSSSSSSSSSTCCSKRNN
ncbi:TBC domain-containing protein, putative [Eimeria maxima]|uniref:TBC domain-containing protein, putative n=1 Tax=Eimeria maxima TaxID=5804 RepID=U6MBE4_EIMMA|nr:TBC domain-containing protein, putative [Eimeria maxima]CDJ61356.1 TBC domain-containing protein, putative [Eimeria maxima]